jgi:SH3-like domain-containing protein
MPRSFIRIGILLLIPLALILALLVYVIRVRGGDSETGGTPTAEGTETAGGERGGSAGDEANDENTPSPTRRATPTLRPFGTALAAGENPQVRVIYSSIHVREGDGLEHASLGYLYEDDVIHALKVNDAGTWYEVRLEDGRTGWVATSVVEPLNEAPLFANVVSPLVLVGEMEVTPSSVNLRMGPGTQYWIMRRLFAGDAVQVIGRTAAGDWFYVQSEGGYLGWLANSVVTYEDDLKVNELPIVQFTEETLP